MISSLKNSRPDCGEVNIIIVKSQFKDAHQDFLPISIFLNVFKILNKALV